MSLRASPSQGVPLGALSVARQTRESAGTPALFSFWRLELRGGRRIGIHAHATRARRRERQAGAGGSRSCSREHAAPSAPRMAGHADGHGPGIALDINR
ncbi:hypothetical protein BCEN4_1050006 [Burkholderia cenocepacia]|nr:hypothetical protein BCEN4_1050006 [Burkholderia cenocepacia]